MVFSAPCLANTTGSSLVGWFNVFYKKRSRFVEAPTTHNHTSPRYLMIYEVLLPILEFQYQNEGIFSNMKVLSYCLQIARKLAKPLLMWIPPPFREHAAGS